LIDGNCVFRENIDESVHVHSSTIFFFILSKRRLNRLEEQLATVLEILKMIDSASFPPHPKLPTPTLPPPSTDSLPLSLRYQMLGPDIGNFPSQKTNSGPEPMQMGKGGLSSTFTSGLHLITDPSSP